MMALGPHKNPTKAACSETQVKIKMKFKLRSSKSYTLSTTPVADLSYKKGCLLHSVHTGGSKKSFSIVTKVIKYKIRKDKTRTGLLSKYTK